MKRLTSVADSETKFLMSTEVGDQEMDAIELVILWDSCAKGESLALRYEALAKKLSDILNLKVTLGFAYLAVEIAVGLLAELKKTHIELLS